VNRSLERWTKEQVSKRKKLTHAQDDQKTTGNQPSLEHPITTIPKIQLPNILKPIKEQLTPEIVQNLVRLGHYSEIEADLQGWRERKRTNSDLSHPCSVEAPITNEFFNKMLGLYHRHWKRMSKQSYHRSTKIFADECNTVMDVWRMRQSDEVTKTYMNYLTINSHPKSSLPH
jgi:hypothetical protein